MAQAKVTHASKMPSRPVHRKVHWRAPAVIALATVSAIAFAVGHHAFYSALDGEAVDSHLFDQQTNVAIGTAFAFLVRACLVTAIGTSFWQIFWRTILRQNLVVSQVDSLAGMLGSLLDFTDIRALICGPALVALAVLSWMVPFASLLPPATLSVLPVSSLQNTSSLVSIPDFTNFAMANTNYRILGGGVAMTTDGEIIRGTPQIIDFYHKRTLQLARLTAQTANQGAIPEHQTSRANSTYSVDFAAPAVRCQSVSSDIMQPFRLAAGCASSSSNNSALEYPACRDDLLYLSWIPNGTHVVPFEPDSLKDGLIPSEISPSTSYEATRYLGSVNGSSPTVFVATRRPIGVPSWTNWDVLNCSMYNATYVANISSNSNRRSVPRIYEVQELNPMALKIEGSMRNDTTPLLLSETINYSYLALMESLAAILVGTISGHPINNESFYYDEKYVTVQSVDLMRTLLAFTRELLPFIARSESATGNFPKASNDEGQWTIVAGQPSEGTTALLPNEAFHATTFNQSLGPMIEQLFQNITLSMFSQPRHLRESDRPVNVTLSHTRNTYIYTRKNLLLSYGLALGLTLLASIAGCISIYSDGASYSNRFSTVLRTTRGPFLEELVAPDDRKGADPLPRYLAKAHVELGHGDSAFDQKKESQHLPQHKLDIANEHSAMMPLYQDHEQRQVDAGEVSDSVSERSVVLVSNSDGTSSEVSRLEPEAAIERRTATDFT